MWVQLLSQITNLASSYVITPELYLEKKNWMLLTEYVYYGMQIFFFF